VPASCSALRQRTLFGGVRPPDFARLGHPAHSSRQGPCAPSVIGPRRDGLQRVDRGEDRGRAGAKRKKKGTAALPAERGRAGGSTRSRSPETVESAPQEGVVLAGAAPVEKQDAASRRSAREAAVARREPRIFTESAGSRGCSPLPSPQAVPGWADELQTKCGSQVGPPCSSHLI